MSTPQITSVPCSPSSSASPSSDMTSIIKQLQFDEDAQKNVLIEAPPADLPMETEPEVEFPTFAAAAEPRFEEALALPTASASKKRKTSSNQSTPSSRRNSVSGSYSARRASRSNSVTRASLSHDPRSARKSAVEPSSAKKPKLTLPHSPKFHATRSRSNSVISSQEMEMARLKQEMKELAALKALNNKAKDAVLYKSAVSLPHRNIRPLTQPKDLHLHTADRSRVHAVVEDKKEEVKKESTHKFGELTRPVPFSFHTQQRSRSNSLSAENNENEHKPSRAELVNDKGLTLVKPFSLHTEHRRPSQPSLDVKPFVSLASAASAVFAERSEVPVTNATMQQGTLTAPKPFHLRTDERVREEGEKLSTEDKIVKELADWEKQKEKEKAQKAKELHAIQHRSLQTFRAPATLTQPQPFHLTEMPARPVKDPESDRAQVEKEREEHRKKVVEAAKGQNGITVPLSPKFHTLSRSSSRASSPSASPSPSRRNSLSQTPSRRGSISSSGPLKLTEPKPFNLMSEQRGAEKQEQFQSKLAQEEQEMRQQREFQAAPLVESAPMVPHLPHRKVVPDQPFHLRSVERHQVAQQQFQGYVHVLQEQDAEQRRFTAQPLPATHHQPVYPKAVEKPLPTLPLDVKLSTDERADKRHEFDMEIKLRDEANQREAERRAAEKKREEQQQLKEYRSSLVHKPLPVPVTSQNPQYRASKTFAAPR